MSKKSPILLPGFEFTSILSQKRYELDYKQWPEPPDGRPYLVPGAEQFKKVDRSWLRRRATDSADQVEGKIRRRAHGGGKQQKRFAYSLLDAHAIMPDLIPAK